MIHGIATKEKLHRLNRRWIREFILGGQDGLVNVLGIILGVASATNSTKIVLIAGISALFAESISMGAVAYTSAKASNDFYKSMRAIEKQEIEQKPDEERREILQIYKSKGFTGSLLSSIVSKITSNKKLWLETMMKDELGLQPDQSSNASKVGWIVFLATIAGSLIPLAPFFFLEVFSGIVTSFLLSVLVLFIAGAAKAKLTIGSWKRAGIEMALIGTLAAVVGYVIGKGLEILLA